MKKRIIAVFIICVFVLSGLVYADIPVPKTWDEVLAEYDVDPNVRYLYLSDGDTENRAYYGSNGNIVAFETGVTSGDIYTYYNEFYDTNGQLSSTSSGYFNNKTEAETGVTYDPSGKEIGRTIVGDEGIGYESYNGKYFKTTRDANGYWDREQVTPDEIPEYYQMMLGLTATAYNPPAIEDIPVKKGTWHEDEEGIWYQFPNGKSAYGWQRISGIWYFFDTDGYLVTDAWQGDYYLTADGSMAVDMWIDGYYVDVRGKWIPDKNPWSKDNYGWKYMDVRSQWLMIDGLWYYFFDDGHMAANTWVGDYYLTSDGSMAVDTWIGEYYVDRTGRWIP